MGFASLGPNYRPLRGACVWKHLGTRWNDFSTILQQGAGEGWGGVSGQRRHPPPPGANVPAFPFFRWIAGAKLRTLSIYFPGTTTTGLFLRWRAILGPCYIYFKWGLLHIDALPRTTPDNHVELSSVCVCVSCSFLQKLALDDFGDIPASYQHLGKGVGSWYWSWFQRNWFMWFMWLKRLFQEGIVFSTSLSGLNQVSTEGSWICLLKFSSIFDATSWNFCRFVLCGQFGSCGYHETTLGEVQGRCLDRRSLIESMS